MAGSLNKVILIGRLGQDPKLTYLPSGNPVANFNVATDESYKDRDGNKVERTEWHRVAVYGRSAEFCGNYLTKGRLVYIEGSLRTRKWQGQDGQDRYTTEVVVTGPGHTVNFLDSRSQTTDAPQGEYGGQQRQQRQGQEGRQASQPAPRHDDDLGPAFPSEASGMDDVPF
ncbi:single-stranded DNA-binding protein [Desulfolutivibrio sulfoxidireducens]|uniref:single-stranded DNA-binding protein n=1 Tax=Desulfolutivibrio sulfoxidireducens TaxID=2773299 RepID=UPI00159D08F2|nr:single-stranded DNA-binding protein [Desulfolutivibrio sulfoxidireducens]QLA15655.1 single-stranded DNA-binding protein [Desulfolutivibrio sulfoxidireducens]QLA19261.1 single-stranded DNA-binding protein [Desulfolutivibrio sulfoxidireducens]